MKKLFTLILSLTLLVSFSEVAYSQGGIAFPKSCLKIEKKATTGIPKNAKLNLTLKKADVSGLTIPVSLVQYQYTSESGLVSTGGVAAGIGFIQGAASIDIKNDSTPVLSGISYWGIAAFYRTDGEGGQHYIPGLIAGFDMFAFHLGVDVSPTHKPAPSVSLSANLLNLPFINELFSIKPKS